MLLVISGIALVGSILMGLTMFGCHSRTYRQVKGILYNPLMGFAPNADYQEAVGDNTLVYVDVTWRELEPQEGVYDFTTIEESNLLEHWRTLGKNVVFRFVCDIPGEEAHMDIPDWLYEKTGDGTGYDTDYGKGYSPDYKNEIFIAAHKKAVEALGKAYGQDSFFAYIELGSLGHWGEWHVKYEDGIIRIPQMRVQQEYVEPYITAFPNAQLLMRRPFAMVSEDGLGVYNDMTGEPAATAEWLSWIDKGGEYAQPKESEQLSACPDIWETSPVGGEFTSSLTMENMLVDELPQTLELLAQSHMTFIGPKCPIANGELIQYPDSVQQILAQVGYRFGISKSRITYAKLTGSAWVKLTLHNYGVAPMYQDWPVCLYVYNETEAVWKSYPLDVSLAELTGGASIQVTQKVADYSTKAGISRMGIGIVNPDTKKPAVALDMDVTAEGNIYLLNEE